MIERGDAVLGKQDAVTALLQVTLQQLSKGGLVLGQQ